MGARDDHLRNHAFYKKSTGAEYVLTPGYDIVPNVGLQGSHAIALGAFGSSPSKDNLEAAAHRMGISRKAAQRATEEVLVVTDDWRTYMKDAGVVASDIAILKRCFAYGKVLHEFVKGA